MLGRYFMEVPITYDLIIHERHKIHCMKIFVGIVCTVVE